MAGRTLAPMVSTPGTPMKVLDIAAGHGLYGIALAQFNPAAQIVAVRMTPSVFSALGVAPLMGRFFTDQEDQQKQQVAVLSYPTWKSRFSGNPNILGTKILLDRKPYLIIGVMPSNFEFPLSPGRLNRSELWAPMSLSPQELSPEANASWYLNLVGRLKPGVTPAQAQGDAERVAQQIMRNYPPDEANFRIKPVVYPLQQITVLQTRPLLRMLFLAVGCFVFSFLPGPSHLSIHKYEHPSGVSAISRTAYLASRSYAP